jgi:hypothetical protein
MPKPKRAPVTADAHGTDTPPMTLLDKAAFLLALDPDVASAFEHLADRAIARLDPHGRQRAEWVNQRRPDGGPQ